jgi:hypothetical protein
MRYFCEISGLGPYLKPLHSVPIDKIARKDASARLLKVSKAHGPSIAVGLRSALNILFAWGMQMGLCETNR